MLDNKHLNKNEQRLYLKTLRQAIPNELRQEKSLSISKQIILSSEYKSSKQIMVYLSFGSEVMTSHITQDIIKQGKRLIVPCCSTNDFTITAYEIENISELTVGSYGILEPDPKLIESGTLKAVNKSSIDIVIVPGLGFDRSGYRIGYGKGYYDRFLSDFTGTTIGLCYSECLLKGVHHDKFDVKVDRVITDNINNKNIKN